MRRLARNSCLALAAGLALASSQANAQVIAPGATGTAGAGAPAPVTLRGTVSAQPEVPRGGIARPRLRNPQARVQRPVQGAVQGPALRGVQPPLQQPVYDARASALPTAGLPPGPAPPPRRRPNADDPFEPLGLRVGTFVLRPSVEAGIGTTDNVNGTATDRIASAFSRVAAGARLDSNWDNHALTARARVERQDYRSPDVDERLVVETGADLRLDIDRQRQLDLGVAFRRTPETLSTFGLPARAVGRPDVDTLSGSATLTQRLARFQFRLRGQYDQVRYEDTRLSDGTSASNALRDVDISTATLRAGYEISPAVQPFLEASVNTRRFRVERDDLGRQQGSDGGVVRAGIATDLGPKLRGELSVGWLYQRPEDPLARDVSGLAVDGTLAWSVSALTTLRGSLRTSVLDTSNTGVVGSTGGIARDVTLAIDHALRRNVLLTASLGLGQDDFVGVERTDRRVDATFRAQWRLNRTLTWQIQASHQRLESTEPGNDFRINTISTLIRVEF